MSERPRIHYVGSFVLSDEITKPAVSTAGNLCQSNLVAGLEKHATIVQAISYSPNQFFPKGNTLLYPGKRKRIGEAVDYYAVPYINLPFLRAPIVNFFVVLELLKHAKKSDIVVFYNLYIPFPLVILVLRKLLKVKIFAIVYDIHIPGETAPNSLRWKWEFFKHKFFMPRLDGVIAITRKILRDFNCEQKSLVMEGGISTAVLKKSTTPIVTKAKKQTILYAGALNRNNGIDLILSAFQKLKNENVELIIAGDGELKCAVEDAARKDPRILFLGRLPHSSVLELYERATLLLCIRVTRAIDTPYFFPSKLIEYFATGIPVLCTSVESHNFKLSDFACVLEDETDYGILRGIEECLFGNRKRYELLAKNAQIFVTDHMVWEQQAERMAKLFNSIT